MNTKTVSLAGEMLMSAADKMEYKPVPTLKRPQFASRELFGGGNELHIEHNAEIYTLRKTSKGKLILTK
jgi:hemin uptake protein HemP